MSREKGLIQRLGRGSHGLSAKVMEGEAKRPPTITKSEPGGSQDFQYFIILVVMMGQHQLHRLFFPQKLQKNYKLIEDICQSHQSSRIVSLAPTAALIVTVVYYSIYIGPQRSHFLRFQAFLPIYLVFLFEN